MTKLSANEMIQLLKQGMLRPSLVLEGMVKPSDASTGTFLFSAGTSCLDWVEIDADSVEHAEVLYNARCQDHSHAFVRLTMKTADVNDKQGTTWSRLATHLNSELIAAQSRDPDNPGGPSWLVCRSKPWTPGC